VSRAVLFGKLPAHGDFVARGLDDAWQAELDAAISRAMLCAQDRFGDSFEDRFLAAPPWRCAISRSGSFLGGALAPSLDSAGRLYPVFLARWSDAAETAARQAQACEELLFGAIPDRWSADQLWNAAEGLPEAEPDMEQEPGWWLDGGDALPSPTPRLSGALPGNLLAEMIAVTEQFA
jgi:type VI secretion system protein ImpM